MNQKTIKIINIILAILIFALVLLLFHRFSIQNSTRIKAQNLVYAEDAARQTAMRINDTLKNNLFLIERYAHFLSFFMNYSSINEELISELERDSPFNSARFTNRHGLTFSPEGKIDNVAGQEFFRNGMAGKSGISVDMHSTIFQQPVLSFYAPLVHDHRVNGILEGSYLADSNLRQLLQTSYFGKPADVFLCLPDGTIIANSSSTTYSGNVLKVMFRSGIINEEARNKAEALFGSGKDGVIYSDGKGTVDNICIMHLPSFNYVLVQSFPDGVTQAMVDNANLAGIQLEIFLLILSMLAGAWILVQGKMQKLALERQNRIFSTVVKGMSAIFDPHYYICNLTDNSYSSISTKPNINNYQSNAEAGSYIQLLEKYSGNISSEEEKQAFFNYFNPAHLTQLLSSSAITIFECHLRDGKRDIWENRIASCVERDEKGVPVRALLLRQNVTEMKERELEAEKRLSIMDRKEKQYRLAATANAMSNYEIDLTKNRLLTDIRAKIDGSQISLLQLFRLPENCSASDLFKAWEACIAPASLDEYKKVANIESLKESYRQGRTEVDVDFWCTLDKQELCLRQAFYLTREDGLEDSEDSLIAMCVVRDITTLARAQRIQTETLQEALAQAKHANEAKTTFLSNMSHDIRTPMNAIIGFATIAASHLDNREQVRDCLQKVLSSSNHLLCLINDILDMSRIESGKMQLNIRECNISELMHNLVNLIQPQIKAKKLNIFIDSGDVTNEDVYTDPLKINQIFINLLGNAVKYTPAGGTIHFGINQEKAFKHGYAKYIFTVQDNGIGMSEEFVKHIFEPFERESTTTISGIQGTGLGMAITKNIIEMMNGQIEVESVPNEGSTFRVALTLKIQEKGIDNQEIRQFENMRVLIVDDDYHVCDSVAKICKRLGIRAEWTTSGTEACYRARFAKDEGDPFQAFIIDWQMPELSGLETTRKIRRIAGKEAIIIILTAYEWIDIEEEARAAGVTAFCAKPLFLSDLKNALLARNAPPIAENSATTASEIFKGKRVLLVDDLEMNREVAEFILTESGFLVEMAPDGTDAVDMIKKSPENYYDIVLMDVQMPTMNGYEATRIIRSLDRADIKTMPIIAMTANALEDDREAALKSGMDAHIAKPIDIENFFTVLGNFVDRATADGQES